MSKMSGGAKFFAGCAASLLVAGVAFRSWTMVVMATGYVVAARAWDR
jgi:hypothetical protein